MNRRPLHIAGWVLLALALVLLLYAGAGYLLAPRVAERYLPGWIEERFGLQTTIGSTSFDPFLLTFEAADVQLTEPGRAPAATVASVHADLEWSSLFRRGWTLSLLRLDGLDLRIERRPDGSVALPGAARPVDAEGKAATAASPAATGAAGAAAATGADGARQGNGGERAPLHARHVIVTDSRVVYVDHTVDGSPEFVVAPIDAKLRNVGTSPEDTGSYALTARLPGDANLAADGTVSMVPFASEGRISVAGLEPSVYWPLLREHSGLAEPRGRLDIEGTYRSSTDGDGRTFVLEPFSLQLADLHLQPAGGGAPLIAAGHGSVRSGRFDLRQRQVDLTEATLERGQLNVVIDENGVSNWGTLVAARERAAEPAPPWHLIARTLNVERMAFRYANASGGRSEYSIGSIDGAGTLELTPGQSPMQLRISGAGLRLTDVAASGADRDVVETARSALLAGAYLDIGARTVGAESLEAVGADLSLVRHENGSLGTPLLAPRVDDDEAGIDRAAAPETARDAGPGWRYGFGLLTVAGSRVKFVDRSLRQAAALSFEPMSARVENLGALTPEPARYSLQAGLAGDATASANGSVSREPFASAGSFRIERVPAGVVWPFLRGQLNLAEPAGRIDASGSYRIEPRGEAQGTAVAIDALALQARGLRLALPDAMQPLLTAQRLDVRDGSVDLAARRLELAQVTLSQADVAVESAPDGTIDWTRLLAQQKSGGQPAARAEPWELSARSVRLDRVGVRYVDRDRSGALAFEAAAVDGTASVAARAGGGGKASVVVQDAGLEIARLEFGRTGSSARERIEKLSVTAAFLDSARKRVGAGTLRARGGSFSVLRDKQGRIRTRVFGPFGAASAEATGDRRAKQAGEPARQQPAKADEAADSWRYRIGSAQADSIAVRVADLGFQPPISYQATVSAAVGNLDPESADPLRFEASMAIEPGTGKARASGTASQDFSGVRAGVSIQGLDFSGLQPLVGRYATLELRSGLLAVDAKLVYQAGHSPVLQANGRFAITDVLVDEEESGERFLSWKRLATDAFTLEFGPGRLVIEQMLAEQPGARIQVSENRELNLPAALRRGESAEAPRSTAGPATQDIGARNAGTEVADDGDGPLGGFDLRIDRIDFRNGTVDFGDASLVLPFSASVERMHGTALGISSARGNQAVLKAEGRIEPFGQARVVGRILPLSPTRFTDILVDIENVSMPLLSPYTATFAGRTVESGRLWLELRYRIVEQELKGQNRIVLRDLRLGERVRSGSALDVPLDLAVALLTDEQGRISVEVPVSGDVGKVEFDYGALIREAVTSTIRRIVAAPFQFLAGIGGGARDGDLGGVAFEPGRSRLLPQQEEKLARIAVAMAQRPALTLLVRGAYHPAQDANALREMVARRAVVEATGAALAADEPPGPIAFDQPGIVAALERLLLEQAGPEEVERIRAQYQPAPGGDPDSVPMAMYTRLVELQPLDENRLRMLAVERSRRIFEYLTLSQGVVAERIRLGEIVTREDAPQQTVIAPLGLAAAQ